MIRPKITRMLLVLAMAVGMMALATPTAQAATYCGTYTKTWYLSDGSVSLRVAWIKTHLEVCSNNSSIVSTAESVESGVTGPGTTAGFVVRYGLAYRTSSGSTSAHYTSNGSLKDCVPYFLTFCSRAENIFVNSAVGMQPTIVVRPGPGQLKIGSRVFTFSFTPHDVYPAVVHFNNTI
jgi:hypothetical protein